MLRLLAFLLLLPTALLAQDAPRTILVLDGSGSMWGQIDGVNKIVIARDVMTDLLATLPPEQELGLMSYGHRRKGDCSDIELMIAPGTDRMAIAEAVRGIKPKGKTPLSAAVIAAAEALRYTEEAATVILVSDGIETCDMDPCAVGGNLEQTGVDFTAHVIGFDVGADPVAQAQLRCLAEATGGIYRDAANADELAGALEEVVVVTEPEPMPVSTVVTFRAIDGPGGTEIAEGLIWNIGTETAGEIIVNDDEPTQLLDIFPGTGLAEVLRISDEATAEAAFTVAEGAGPMTVTLVMPEFLPAATVSGPEQAASGSTVEVAWTGPNLEHDKITVVPMGTENSAQNAYAFTSDGSPVRVALPMKEGPWEIRYLMADGTKVLARQPITLVAVSASLDGPAEVVSGADFTVAWTGPDYDRDFVAIARPNDRDTGYESRAYTGNGNPAELRAPLKPGAYELRYAANDNGTRVLARAPLSVIEAGATLEAPESAPAGTEIVVRFTGPMGASDRIVLAAPNDTNINGEDYAGASDGSPVTLSVPYAPGQYELRYLQRGGGTATLVTRPLEVTAVSATISGPATAFAAEDIEVAFTGPMNPYDSVVLTPAGGDSDDYLDAESASDGSPIELTAPLEPGDYVLRYQLGGRHGEIIAEQPFSVIMPEATLAPPTGPALAGGEIEASFTGPAFGYDIVAITPAGGDSDDYEEAASADDGSPVTLQVPREPGDYVLRYQLGGRHGVILAEQPIRVDLPEASLTAPPTPIAAGTEFDLAFTGPIFSNDWIAIVPVGEEANANIESTRASRSNPAALTAPDAPGDYEVIYSLGGRHGTVLARIPLTVTAP